eukprot:TRINITY_DN5883_c0_g1_i6.p2 TRINITY_DN5883_c0_g1~~TRINITY_DN5883_c0_g1_i6.p2  ORF type:complete len:102 (+),score=15.38 TRINITY_DN5883_c0_g1_i6:473-778(+)
MPTVLFSSSLSLSSLQLSPSLLLAFRSAELRDGRPHVRTRKYFFARVRRWFCLEPRTTEDNLSMNKLRGGEGGEATAAQVWIFIFFCYCSVTGMQDDDGEP